MSKEKFIIGQMVHVFTFKNNAKILKYDEKLNSYDVELDNQIFENIPEETLSEMKLEISTKKDLIS